MSVGSALKMSARWLEMKYAGSAVRMLFPCAMKLCPGVCWSVLRLSSDWLEVGKSGVWVGSSWSSSCVSLVLSMS